MKLKIKSTYLLLLLLPLAFGGLGGCAGTQSFGTAARAGDTVVLPVGWLNLKRQNLTVTIADANSIVTTYSPGSDAVRAVANLYPDPSSLAVVSSRTKTGLGPGGNINGWVTGQDREWWQSIIMLNLPSSLAPGIATINIVDSAGASIPPLTVTVLPGTGSPSSFEATFGGGPVNWLSAFPSYLRDMETTARYMVTFSGGVMPHSIQLGFTHTPGVGVPWIVNPTGDMKSAVWSDDTNGNLKVMLAPINGITLPKLTGINNPIAVGLVQFKFYIAGGITGLSQPTIKAYDITGSPITGVTATVTAQ